MRFIDEVNLYAKAGDGGNGCVSWRREKFIARGGPAGGDGGNGGNVVLEADEDVHSLLDFRYQPRIIAQSGENGRSKNQYGKNGEDAVAKVPVGTQVFDLDTNECIADLTVNKERVTICKGGSGGFGNTRFTSSTRQAPEFANPGLEGQEKSLRFSLKLLADVGLLGFPNAGKSTLLSRMSAAKPKIANYPFTTLAPQLGVVSVDDGRSFVMADIPGLIEGASKGAGLGFRFLKHLERVRVLCHLIEPTCNDIVSEEKNINSDKYLITRYETIRKELEIFSDTLCEVPEIVVLSKGDIVDDSQKKAITKLKAFLKKKNIAFLEISAVTGKNVKTLTLDLWMMIKQAKKEESL
ncbi:MAG: GTPase ObgE [bacterium]|nr:GTPase ObgE [bacterium]